MRILANLFFAVLLLNGTYVQASASFASGCSVGHNTGACSEAQQVASLARLPPEGRVKSELPVKSREVGRDFAVVHDGRPALSIQTVAADAEVPNPESKPYVLMLVGVVLMAFIARRRLD